MAASSIPDRLQQLREEADRRDEEIRQRAEWLKLRRHDAGERGVAAEAAAAPAAPDTVPGR
jgi:hypothetical protein